MLVQIPGVDVAARAAAEKGSALTPREAAILDRARRQRPAAGSTVYAPDRAVIRVHDTLPDAVAELDDAQRAYLAALADAVGPDAPPAAGDDWQNAIFAVATEADLPAGRAFDAIYRAFLGRTNGPRAGWLLASLDAGLRDRPPAGRRRGDPGRRCGMSVGLQRLREEPDVIRQGAIDKGEDPGLVDRALELDERRRALLGESEALKAERNTASKRIGEAIKGGARPDGPEVAELKSASVAAGERISALDARARRGRARARRPDAAHPEPGRSRTPVGGEEANVTIRTWGEPPCPTPWTAATWTRKPHWELGETLDILDNARGAKIAGSGFPVYKGAGSALQRGLIYWFLDVHTQENGFTEVWPPAVVNTASATGTGQIPDKEDQMYVVTRDELYLVPTAEVPVTNLHRDEILDATGAADPLCRLLPVLPARGRRGRQGHPRHPARPPVRQGRDGPVREAGGQPGRPRVDDRTRRDPPPAPRTRLSGAAHEHAGDGLRPGARSTTWRSGRRASSAGSRSARAPTSATTRRAGWRSATGPRPGAKPELVHTLNGSGLALPRIVAAIIETYQQADGSVVVPEVLQRYLGRDAITAPAADEALVRGRRVDRGAGGHVPAQTVRQSPARLDDDRVDDVAGR